MFFNENSALVQLYVKNIREEKITRDDVPNLLNLQDIVYGVLDRAV